MGALLALVSIALIAPGGFLLWAHGTQRDSGGFYATSNKVLSTDAYAVITPDVYLDEEPWSWLPAQDGTVRFRVETTDETPAFLGIGPSAEVAGYLSKVAHDVLDEGGGWFRPVSYRHAAGGAPRTAPGQQGFWAAKQEGAGLLTLEWPVQGGEWTAVLMNADGSAHVTSSVRVGGRLDILLPIGLGLVGAGIMLLGIGVLLIVLGARPSRPSTLAAPIVTAGQHPAAQQAGV
jgi:hypothetical protein